MFEKSIRLIVCVVMVLAMARTGISQQSTAGPGVFTGESAMAGEQLRESVDALRAELEQLRLLVREQGEALEVQRSLLSEQQVRLAGLAIEPGGRIVAGGTGVIRPASAKAPGMAAPQNENELAGRVAQVEQGLSDTKSSVEERVRGFGPFTFSGDLRVRYAPIFGGGRSDQPAPASQQRNRFRLRLNATSRFSEEIGGGLRLASGEVGDPISTNQNITGFFTRKPITIDRAYLSYTPNWLKPLNITAGKWGYTWLRTQMMWDDDLNPEGLSESVTFRWDDSVLRRFTAVAFQLPFFEVKQGKDSALFGWQVQTEWNLGSRARLGANVAYYGYHNPGSIAANHNGGVASFSGGADTGFGGNFGFSGGSVTNATGTIDGVRTFASEFGIVDVITRLDIDTGAEKWPLMFLADFAHNTGVCENLDQFTAAGVAPPDCNPGDGQAYWTEVQFGRTSNAGDARFGYTFLHIERDALVSVFNYSDLRQPTHMVGHRLEAQYKVNGKTTFGLTTLIGRKLGGVGTDTSGESVSERYLKRMQLDFVYQF